MRSFLFAHILGAALFGRLPMLFVEASQLNVRNRCLIAAAYLLQRSPGFYWGRMDNWGKSSWSQRISECFELLFQRQY